MRLLIFLIISSYSCHQLVGQVIDITPPGYWKDVSITILEPNTSFLITAVDSNENASFFLHGGHVGTSGNSNDYQLSKLTQTEAFVSLRYLGKGAGGMIDEFYFLAKDSLGQSHFVRGGRVTSKLNAIPSSGNWNAGALFYEMADGSIYGSLYEEGGGAPQLAKIAIDTVEILTDPINFFPSNPGVSSTRVYEDYTEMSGDVDVLAYYDISLGFVITDIPASSYDVFVGTPSDSIHVLVTNSSAAGYHSKIYRVVDSTFNEVNIPGGPYDNIEVLWQNEQLESTLFGLVDTAGTIRLAKRQEGVWQDLTSEIGLISLLGITKKAAYSHDSFFEINSSQYGRQLFNYQAYEAGDTLFEVTPSEGPYTGMIVQNETIEFPMTIRMDGPEGEYLYSYYYGLSALFIPAHSLDNPNSLPSVDISKKKDNIYSFEYYNTDSSVTTEHLYSRVAPGTVFTPLSVADSVSSYNVCIHDGEVLFQQFLADGRRALFNHNMGVTQEVKLPAIGSDETFALISRDEGCLVEGYLNENPDSITRIYTTTQEDAPLLDITDPRYGRDDIRRINNYLVNTIRVVKSRESDEEKVFMVTPISRRAEEDCTTDYKYYYEPEFPELGDAVMAKQHFFGGEYHMSQGKKGCSQ